MAHPTKLKEVTWLPGKMECAHLRRWSTRCTPPSGVGPKPMPTNTHVTPHLHAHRAAPAAGSSAHGSHAHGSHQGCIAVWQCAPRSCTQQQGVGVRQFIHMQATGRCPARPHAMAQQHGWTPRGHHDMVHAATWGGLPSTHGLQNPQICAQTMRRLRAQQQRATTICMHGHPRTHSACPPCSEQHTIDLTIVSISTPWLRML